MSLEPNYIGWHLCLILANLYSPIQSVLLFIIFVEKRWKLEAQLVWIIRVAHQPTTYHNLLEHLNNKHVIVNATLFFSAFSLEYMYSLQNVTYSPEKKFMLGVNLFLSYLVLWMILHHPWPLLKLQYHIFNNNQNN